MMKDVTVNDEPVKAGIMDERPRSMGVVKNRMPRVSVVVPMYRTPYLLLRRCLDSILNQSFPDLELVVVDDGSGEDYEAIRHEYEARDCRVRFLVKENGGVASARNFGIEASRGEFLVFVDSDDYVDGFYLEGLYRAMPECEMAVCGLAEMEFPVEDFLYNERMFFSLPSHFAKLQYINFSVNKMYRTAILKEYDIRFPLDVKMGEDAMFLAQYYPHCKLIRCVRERWYHYVLNKESAMRVYKPAYWDWESEVIRKDWELFHRYPLAEREEMAMLHWIYEKMMGAANYYYDYEEDPEKLMEFFRKILAHELVQKLFEEDVEPRLRESVEMDLCCFTEEERKILSVVRRQGAQGIRKFVHKRIGE